MQKPYDLPMPQNQNTSRAVNRVQQEFCVCGPAMAGSNLCSFSVKLRVAQL